VIADNVVRQQSVTLGAHEGMLNEVVDGLLGNETIATSNLNQLVTGTKVRLAVAEASGDGTRSGGKTAEGKRGNLGKDSK
jgi:hypothetical protein